MRRIDKKIAVGLVLLCLVVSGVLYGLFPLGLLQYFTDRALLLSVIAEHKKSAAFMFVGLQILQVIAAPVPGEVTGFVGGIFFGAPRGIAYSTIGLTIGSWIAFVLARLAGRPLAEKLVSAETIKRYDYVMKHRGLFLAFLMFLIPGFPKDILCYILGLGHMKHRDFLLISTTGRLLGTVLLTLEGEFFRNGHFAAFFAILGASIGCLMLVMIYRSALDRWFRGMRAAQLRKNRGRRKQRRCEEY